jgi:alpha-D-ribose 1-methylphosphonate 5-triphosphate synthase subunit PhnG
MLKRKMRTEILALMDESKLQEIYTKIDSKYDIEMIEEPSNALVMVKMRESAKKHLFYLGEVYVTECKVMIDGELGLGVIKGEKPNKSKYMAAIDAAYNANLEVLDVIDDMIMNEKKDIDVTKQQRINKILETKVNFETLDEEVKA